MSPKYCRICLRCVPIFEAYGSRTFRYDCTDSLFQYKPARLMNSKILDARLWQARQLIAPIQSGLVT